MAPFHVVVRTVAKLLLAGIDQVPTPKESEDRPGVGGPTEFLDGIQSNTIMGRQSATDLTVQTSAGPVSLVRYYTTSPETNNDEPTYPDGTLAPGPSSPPFDGLLQWTHSFYSFVTQRENHVDPEEPNSPHGLYAYIEARYSTNDINTFPNVQTDAWKPDRGSTSDVWLLRVDGGYVVRRPRDGRYYYQYLGLGDGGLGTYAFNRYFLSRVEDEEYLPDAGARVRYSISYRAAAECGALGASATFVDSVSMPDGQKFVLAYSDAGQSRCALDRVNLVSDADGGTYTAVKYYYTQQNLTRVDQLSSSGTVVSTETYAYTPTSFERSQDGERELRYDLFSPMYGVDGGIHDDTAGNTMGGVVWTWIGSPSLACPSDSGWCEKYSSGSSFSGAGVQSAVTTTQMLQEPLLNIYEGSPRHVTYTTLQCTAGDCSGVSNVNRSWGMTQVSNGLGLNPIDETGYYLDARGFYTNYGWQGSPNGIINDELLWATHGATVSGSDAGLLTTSYTYEYGGQARSPPSNDRLLHTKSMASAVYANHTVTTTYVNDLATNQLKAVITSGYTLTRGSPTAPGASATQRFVGTFYFRNHNCDNDAPDSQGRILEVHGPCDVSGVAATDCNAGSNMPIKRYFYGTSGSSAGMLVKSQVGTVNGGAGACSGGTYLDTLYSNYDERGRPGTVTGPDLTSTSNLYRGDQLVSKSVGSSPILVTSYFYDGKKLTATQNPDGAFDVVCYREGDNGCSTSNTLHDQPQWKARATDQGGVNWFEKTKLTYLNGQLIEEQLYGCPVGTCTGLAGNLERTLRHEKDPLGRAAYEQVGDENINQTPSSGAYYAASLHDAEGNETSIGFPFVQHSRLCGGVGDGVGGHSGAASNCAQLYYDAANRLSQMAPVTGAVTCLQYDSLGRVSSISLKSGSCGGSALETVAYTYDDFGNLVRVLTPWSKSGSGSTDVHVYDYDGRGFMLYKQTPAMRAAPYSDWLEMTYDASGRQLQLWHKNTNSVSEMLYSFDYDTPSASCSFTSSNGFAKGHVARRKDSYGSTWYRYDQFGRTTAEVRVRGQTDVACDSPGPAPTEPNWSATLCPSGTTVDSNDSHLSTYYHYGDNVHLTDMQYPHGRVVRFAYDTTSRLTSISADVKVSGTAACTKQTLLSTIQWEPTGAIRAYQVVSPIDGSTMAVEYFLGSNVVGACTATRPSPTDTVGRLGALFVSRASIGSGTGDVYQAWYGWTADQVVSEAQCLLRTSTSDKPRIVYYVDPAGDPSLRNGYDKAVRLLHANRPASPYRLSDVGGAVGRRDYSYDSLGNRMAATTDCWKFSATYGDSSRPDQLTAYTSVDAGPNPAGVSSPACDASPFATRSYTYDGDGRVSSIKGPNDSSNAAAVDDEFNAGVDSHAALGAVYKSVTLSGGEYDYWYDADGRRRLKAYPTGVQDEFLYGLDSTLLEDRGVSQVMTAPGAPYSLDEYVWLAGRPVLLIRSTLDSTWKRGNDDPGATCTRNGEGSACGVYFIVSDYLPKPVLMLDSKLRVVNAAEYDPFGHINRVASLGHTQHPYSAVNQRILGYFAQPPTSTTKVNIRARFSMVDTAGSGDYAYLADDGNHQLNNTGGVLSASITGPHKGEWISDWVPVPSTGPPTPGRVRVVFHAGSTSPTYKGVALAGYEYRRFDTAPGTVPTWLPLRLPGQYHDAETDLFQNWNRFYDPSIGRYLEPDPLWLYPEKLVPLAQQARTAPVYAYAGNNPVVFVDPTGRIIAVQPGEGASDINAFIDEAFNDVNNPAHEAVIAASMSSTTTTIMGGKDLTGGTGQGPLALTGPTLNGDGIQVQLDKRLSVDHAAGETRASLKFFQNDQFGNRSPGRDSFNGLLGHEFGHVSALLSPFRYNERVSNYMSLEINNGFRALAGQEALDMSYGHPWNTPSNRRGPVQDGPASASPWLNAPWLR